MSLSHIRCLSVTSCAEDIMCYNTVMSEDLLLRYAANSMPPGERARLFVANDPRLQWVDDAIDASENADVVLAGPTLRNILLGSLPQHITVSVDGVTPKQLRHVLAEHGDVHTEASDDVVTFQPTAAPGTTVTVTHTPHERIDFTVDSLRYRTAENALEDPLGTGLRDIHDRRIRVTDYPLRTFANNPLATLRALKLAAEHRLTFADETWHALVRSLPRLNSVTRDDAGKPRFAFPRQVLGASLLETLLACPRYGAALIHASGLGALVAPKSKDNGWQSAAQAMKLLVHDDTLRGHGIAAHDAATVLATFFAFQPNATALAKDIVRDYHLHQFPDGHASHVNVGDVDWLLGNVRMFDDVDPAGLQPSAFEKIFGGQRGRSLLALMHSVFLTEGKHHVARERVHVARRLLDDLDARRPNSPKLLRGRDLATLGVPPGPLYRTLLSKIRDAQLIGSVTTTEDAMHLVRLELARM